MSSVAVRSVVSLPSVSGQQHAHTGSAEISGNTGWLCHGVNWEHDRSLAMFLNKHWSTDMLKRLLTELMYEQCTLAFDRKCFLPVF